VTSNASGAPGTVDVLVLARTVERCVPADLETARACLRSLSEAIAVRLEQQEQPASVDRLRALVATILHDIEGGHVLAVSGLERQLRHYVEESSAARATVAT
jgi:bacterioferritin (cytochrome b1)